MTAKDIGKDQTVNDGNHSQLVQLAVICLAGVSLFTTARGMTEYIFKNDAVAYAASTAIQGILLAMSMGLPKYLNGIWKNKWHVFLRTIVCAIIILLTIVTMFCSSWFSYIYIAGIVHSDSWESDSELLVQQTYREELYSARDYAHIYRTYLEGYMGEKILMLEEQAESISENEQLDNLNMDWAQERLDYGDTSTISGNYMITVIDAMENAIGNSTSGNSRDLAVKAVTDAQDNIGKRMEEIQQRLNEIDASIERHERNIDNLRTRINNAVPGTDTTSLTNSLNRYVQLIESETTTQAALREEYRQLEGASAHLQLYESRLGLSDATSSVAIRNTLLEMQTEFFQEDPDEEKLIETATTIFESLRNAESYDDNSNLSYTDLLMQMNRLILNLKDYSDIKEAESSLEDLIAEFRDERNADSVDMKSDDTDGKAVSDGWKTIWRDRLGRLKSQISSMPVYSDEQTTSEEEAQILTDSQINTLRTYDRNESSNQLDDMIRFYITEHNALYQGLIYLRSPYKMLALFSLILAVAFDLSGFILGFINQGERTKDEINPVRGMLGAGLGKWRTKKVKNIADWSIIPSLNKYKILTGDYKREDDIYIYQVFEDGLLQEWNVEDSEPYIQGIYRQDKTVETRGSLVSSSEQSVLFAKQPEGPRDGVYLNCCLEFEEGSLFLIRDVDDPESKSFLVNANEYVPIHSYSPSKGEGQTLPAEQLSSDKIEAQMVVLALNAKGTRLAAVYILEV